MCITVTEKDLRELHIRRAARVIQFKRACRLRARAPDISANTPLVTLAIPLPHASCGTAIPLPDETYENHSHNHADPRFIGRLQLVA